MSSSATIPEEVDIVILGTGLTNSILAAAFSRIGKSVIHLDRNSYYGDQWASFNLQQLLDYIKDEQPNHECLKNHVEKFQELLAKKSRLFCIDLCPRPLFSTGSMVDLLVSSNVTRYHEFKNNIRILSFVDDGKEIHHIPCQRSDVFNSPLLTNLVDKRKLMKFVELCLETESNEINVNADMPIKQFLHQRGLTSTIVDYLINSIAMVEPEESTRKACDNIKNFMTATQRFGRSPFLLPMYGTGEFPQSFCRLSAVFGGVYCLNTDIKSIEDKFEEENSDKRYKVILANGSQVKSDIVISDHSYATELKLNSSLPKTNKLSRAILITDKSIKSPNEDNSTAFIRIPPSKLNENIVYVLEENSTLMVCPPDINIVYLWTTSWASPREPPKDVLWPIVEKLFPVDEESGNNSIIWSFYYEQTFLNNSMETMFTKDQSLYVTNPPCDHIDYEHSIKEAEQLFKLICPEDEFLPRAPDPDEIIT